MLSVSLGLTRHSHAWTNAGARAALSQPQRLIATATGAHPRGTPPLTVSPPYIELNIERAPAKAETRAHRPPEPSTTAPLAASVRVLLPLLTARLP